MISMQQVQYILAVYKEGSFYKAAEKCFVTQPTLSMQIKKAEEMIDMELFDRNNLPVKLTQKGLDILPHLIELEKSYQGMGDFVKRMKGEFKEKLTIGVIPTMALYLIPDMYGFWKAELGNVILEIKELKTSELIQSLKENTIDLAIFAGPFQFKQMEVIALGREEILGFSNHFKAEKNVKLRDLELIKPWILSKGNCLRTQMLHWCNWSDESLNQQLMANQEWKYEGGNLPILMKMVHQYGGYTLIPEHLPLSSSEKKCSFYIVDDQNQSPAREWIAVFAQNTMKRKVILDLIEPIKQKYFSNKKKKMKILDWN